MATYGYSFSETYVTIEVYGLSYGDSVRFFVRREPATGTMLVDQAFTATSSTMAKSFFVLSAGSTYAINVYVNGVVLGANYFTTPGGQPSVRRPDNWYWSGIYQGGNISLSAYSWNQFCSRINEFRRYKNMSSYSFSSAYSGGAMYAYQANEAWYAINEIGGHGAMPNRVYSGDAIYASFMIQLQDALNAIL